LVAVSLLWERVTTQVDDARLIVENIDERKKRTLRNSRGIQRVRQRFCKNTPGTIRIVSSKLLDVATGYANQASSPGTKSGTTGARDVALKVLIEAWPTLTESTVNTIIRLAQGDSAVRQFD
jgi:hypothetical protein